MLERHPLSKIAAIYAGGVVGVLIRVGLAEAFPHAADAWPWPTFAVNIVGALLIGLIFALLAGRSPQQLHHPFLATGLCGTLTTFSTMQLELLNMVNAGEFALAATYISASLALGYIALRVGLAVGRTRAGVAT